MVLKYEYNGSIFTADVIYDREDANRFGAIKGQLHGIYPHVTFKTYSLKSADIEQAFHDCVKKYVWMHSFRDYADNPENRQHFYIPDSMSVRYLQVIKADNEYYLKATGKTAEEASEKAHSLCKAFAGKGVRAEIINYFDSTATPTRNISFLSCFPFAEELYAGHADHKFTNKLRVILDRQKKKIREV